MPWLITIPLVLKNNFLLACVSSKGRHNILFTFKSPHPHPALCRHPVNMLYPGKGNCKDYVHIKSTRSKSSHTIGNLFLPCSLFSLHSNINTVYSVASPESNELRDVRYFKYFKPCHPAIFMLTIMVIKRAKISNSFPEIE